MSVLEIKSEADSTYDLLALGEVLLRFDPRGGTDSYGKKFSCVGRWRRVQCCPGTEALFRPKNGGGNCIRFVILVKSFRLVNKAIWLVYSQKSTNRKVGL